MRKFGGREHYWEWGESYIGSQHAVSLGRVDSFVLGDREPCFVFVFVLGTGTCSLIQGCLELCGPGSRDMWFRSNLRFALNSDLPNSASQV